MVKLDYRPDIDGLRALAVLAVVIYHFEPNLIVGGFLGVDIFFVISGYLITKIISYEILSNTFSYKNFYLRRIKRILPSFYTVLILTLISAILLFETSDLRSVIKAAISSVFFVSNINFAIGLDYFSPNALEQPLLHFWSLSVEEQYYFLIPFFIILLLGNRAQTTAISIIFFLGFVISVLSATYFSSISRYESISYYMLPTRMYSMLLGSLIVVSRFDRVRIGFSNTICTIAIGALVYSLFYIDKSSNFPGVIGLAPILSTALLIAFGSKSSIVNTIFSNKLSVFIGKISFTLYLVHWPVMSFARYIWMKSEFNVKEILFLSIMIFCITLVIYSLVEKKVRVSKVDFKKALLLYFLLPSISVVILSFAGYRDWIGINKNPKMTTYDYAVDICHNQELKNCFIGGNKGKTALLGDSHAAQYAYLLIDNTKKYGGSFYLRSSSSCPIIPGFSADVIGNINIRTRCEKLKNEFSQLYRSFDTMFISQKWDSYLKSDKDLENLDSFLRSSSDKNLVLVTQVPEYEFDVLRAMRFSGNNNKTDDYKLVNQQLAQFARKYKHVFLLDTAIELESIKHGVIQGEPLYRDSNHINVLGAMYLSSKFNRALNESYKY
ncbi:acyltransferase family protein [Vibrio alginolyticus]|uniref:acyltransferase family protein n=1 Tax=Vibrio alginolyticus TaxID=663 RepID=UPI00406837B5